MVTTPYITTPYITTEDTGTPSYNLGGAFNYSNLLLNSLLAALAIPLNLAVVLFHSRHLRETAPFTHFVLSTSDLVTGVCAAVHALVFFCLQAGVEGVGMSHLVVSSYFLTIVSFRVSCFVSLVFATIRTVNIVWPFRTVNHRAVVVAILVYTAFWVGVFVVDLFILSKVRAGVSADGLREIMIGMFYVPGKLRLLHYITSSGHHVEEETKCAIHLLYTLLPVTLCALLAVGLAALQLVHLARRHNSNWVDNASGTIVLITLVFALCSIPALYQPIYKCVGAHDLSPDGYDTEHRMFYQMGYTAFFLNAALNPLILVIRVKVFRDWLLKMLGSSPKNDPIPGKFKLTVFSKERSMSQATTVSRTSSHRSTLGTVATM